MVNQGYPPKLQLNNSNSSDTEASLLISIPLFLIVSSKIYDKRDDFDFDMVNFLFLDGDVPRRVHLSYYENHGDFVYTLKSIRV